MGMGNVVGWLWVGVCVVGGCSFAFDELLV